MSDKEQAQALVNELHAVINRFRVEYDLNYANAIGCLEMVKLDLYWEGQDGDE